MRKIILLTVCIMLMLSNYSNAQFIDKLSVDINLGRLSKNYGFFESGDYLNHQMSLINGINVNYHSSEKWQQYIGIRKLNYRVSISGGFSGEETTVNGFEFSMGTKLSPNSDKKVFLSYGLEFFGEFGRHKGTYWVDYNPFEYEINHRRDFLGIAPNLTFNLRVHDRILLFANARLRLGKVYLNQQERTDLSREFFYSNNQYWLSVVEPLNTIGVRIELHQDSK